MKKILIIEPELSGHHLSYLEWIVSGALKNGYSVAIGTTPDSKSALLSEAGFSTVEFVTYEPMPTMHMYGSALIDAKREISYWKWARRINNEVSGHSLVFLPYFDYMLNAIAILGSPFGDTKFAGICMRPTFHHVTQGVNTPSSIMSNFKRVLFYKLVRNKKLGKLFTIDKALCEYFENKTDGKHSKVQYLPDPSETRGVKNKECSRRLLHLPLGKKIVLIYGSITRRKGFFELVEYVLKSNSSDLHILLAGKQDMEIQDYISKHNQQLSCFLTQINRRISNEEETLIFSAVDYAWICYDQHYTMSGQMIKAAQHGVRIFAKNEGLIGWYTANYDIGVVVDIKSDTSIDEGFRRIDSVTVDVEYWCEEYSTAKAVDVIFGGENEW